MIVTRSVSSGGKTALVTGARRGIGKAWRSRWRKQARTSWVSAGRWNLRAAISRSGSRRARRFTASPATSGTACGVRVVGKVNAPFAAIDILVNNGGSILRKPAAEHPDEYWDKIIEIEPERAVRAGARIRPRHAGAGQRKDHFHGVAADFQGGITVPGYAAAKAASRS